MSLSRILSKLKIVKRFLIFWSKARSIDSVDSPLLYDLCQNIKTSSHNPEEIQKIENRRKALSTNQATISRQSLGAPSTVHNQDMVSISQLTHSAVSPKYKCELLLSIVRWSGSERILELGTSLGISTAYIASIDSVSSIDTVEGSSSISDINSQDPHSNKIRFHNSSFQDFLDACNKTGDTYDCIVLDGHHEYEPTLTYIDQCMGLLNAEGIIIMDDIYWSTGMMKAWKELNARHDWNLKIDLFFYGVLTKKSSVQESINIRLWPFKYRWQLGLFR